jgi:hypothetical protein
MNDTPYRTATLTPPARRPWWHALAWHLSTEWQLRRRAAGGAWERRVAVHIVGWLEVWVRASERWAYTYAVAGTEDWPERNAS